MSMNQNEYTTSDLTDIARYFTNDLREKAIRFFLNNEKPNENNLNQLIIKYKAFIEYSYRVDLVASNMSDDAKNILANILHEELKTLKIFNEELYNW